MAVSRLPQLVVLVPVAGLGRVSALLESWQEYLAPQSLQQSPAVLVALLALRRGLVVFLQGPAVVD